MIEDSLSHFISVLQATLEVTDETEVARVSTRAPDAGRMVLELEIAGPFPAVRGRLELEHCAHQPWPAWIEIDGARMDRGLRLPEYAFSFTGGDREVETNDPRKSLVYGFGDLLRGRDLDRLTSERTSIHRRARLYQAILAAV